MQCQRRKNKSIWRVQGILGSQLRPVEGEGSLPISRSSSVRRGGEVFNPAGGSHRALFNLFSPNAAASVSQMTHINPLPKIPGKARGWCLALMHLSLRIQGEPEPLFNDHGRC